MIYFKEDIEAWKRRREEAEKQFVKDMDEIHKHFPRSKRYTRLRDFENIVLFAKLMDDKKLGVDAIEAYALCYPEDATECLDILKRAQEKLLKAYEQHYGKL